jgi:predicted  nucleic acid-binding Zn-ribbon protein
MQKLCDNAVVNSDTEKLLVLQVRDKTLFDIESALTDFPAKRAIIEDKIKAEESALKDLQNKINNAEVERSNLRIERRGKESKAESMKEQRQTLMKKPAEYKALEHFIESLLKEAGQIEEKEIELLYSIDELKADFEKEQELRQKNIELFQNEIKRLEEEKTVLESRLEETRFKAREAESGISSEYLQAYEALKKRGKRRPYLVKVEDGKCSGCHLKLSAEILQQAKEAKAPVNCEMCGRMIYFE